MICSTCENAIIRKLEVGMDKGQRITCAIDGWMNLQTVVECNQYRARVYEIGVNASVSSEMEVEEEVKKRGWPKGRPRK